MRSGIVRTDGAVVPRGNHLPVFHHHRAHGHFASRSCCLCGLQGKFKELCVLGGLIHTKQFKVKT
jgi:hypothetical protein